MNKIMVVGHPDSGYGQVEGLLTARGMAVAAPSRRDGCTPQQITETLRQAHRSPPLEHLEPGSELRRIDVGAIWNGMALDLMLGNLNRPVWGWADPQSIFVLDYWRDVDPGIHFILVYDAPHSVLTRIAADQAAGISAQDLARRAHQWTAYNAALLHFFHRQPQRCLLVHACQVAAAPSEFLQQLRARINAPCFDHAECPSGGRHGSSDAPRRIDAGAVNADAHALTGFLAHALMRQNISSLELFDELQASASLPLAESDESDQCGPLAAWRAMAEQQQRLGTQTLRADEMRCRIDQLNGQLTLADGLAGQKQQLTERLRKAQEHVEQLQQRQVAEHKQAQEQAKQASEKLERLQQQLSGSQTRHQAELTQRAAACQALGEERDQLISQLHQVQEALERYYLEIGRLKQATPVQTPPPAAVQPASAQFGAAQRVKSQLSYRLGNTMIACSRSVGGWLVMPFALWRVARQFHREKPEREARKLPPIHQYRDAHEADRLKAHLSYRLGHVMVHNLRSPLGWVAMPSALLRQVREFRLQQRS